MGLAVNTKTVTSRAATSRTVRGKMVIKTIQTAHKFTRLAAVLLAVSLLSPVLAQDAAGNAPAPVMDGVAVISEGRSVSLRWSLPDGAFPEGGFRVERISANGSVTTVAVPSPRPWQELLAEAGDADGPVISEEAYRAVQELFAAEAVSQTSEDDTGLQLLRAFYTLEMAVNPDLAAALGLLFRDEDVTLGERYSYEVFTGAGRRVGTAAITVGTTPPLAAPSGLRAIPTAAGIELIWDRAAEQDLVFAYRIWTAAPGAGQPTLLTPDWFTPPAPAPEGDDGVVEETYWYRDEGREPGTAVQYSIIGRDLFGRETPPTTPVLAVMPDPRALPQPLVVEAATGDRSISLTWAVEPDERIVAIGVLRSRGLDVDAELVSPLLEPSATSWTDENLLGGEDYHYAIAAFDADGAAAIGPIWTQRAVNPKGPEAVSDLTLEPSTTALLLTWTAPPQVDVGRYQVYAGRPGASFEEMTLLGETVLRSYSAPIPENTLFDVAYRVRAVNTSDVAGAVSSEVSGRPLDLTPPSAPLWADVTGEEEQISLTWLRDLDPDISFLRLLRATEDGGFEVLIDELALEQTTHLDREVIAGVSYRYALQAVDAAGNESELSEAAQAAAWSLTPAATVTNLEAVLLEDGGVHLSWSAGEPAGTGWVVSRLLNGNWVEVSDLLTVPGFVDDRAAAGDTFRVTSYSSTGQAGEPVEIIVR